MSAVKLTHNGQTRRVQFPDEHPSWADLSHRVEALFGIPAANLALSYVDPDGDTTFVSSNDELFDMFHTVPTEPRSGPPVHRFTVHDMRQTNKADDDGSDASSSSSSSVSDVGEVPILGDRRTSQGTGVGLGGMGIGFAPFEMMFGHAATAASVKSPSQGHISPVPTGTDFGVAAAEAGLTRSQYGRPVASSVATSVVGDHEGNPTIHIQQPSTDADARSSIYEHEEPGPIMHPTPALYQDVAQFIHALSGAAATHPEVSGTFGRLLNNAHSNIYWDEHAHAPEDQQAAAHNLLGAINSLLHTFFPPPPPRTPTQAAATPAYTAAQYELPPSVIADETPIPSRLNTPSVAPVPVPEMGSLMGSQMGSQMGSPAMSATSVPSTVQGPRIRPVLDMARADRASVRSDTDAGSVVSGGMGSPIRGTGPAWRFAGRSGNAPVPPQAATGWGYSALGPQAGAMVPAPQVQVPADASKYVESRVKLEHMKEMYKQTKEEYRREREERKREREARKQGRGLIAGPPETVAPPPPAQGDMFDKLNQALAQAQGRAGPGPDTGRSGMVPAPRSVAGSAITNETAVRTRQQLNNWLVEQLGDMGFSAATHPQVSRMVRDATRPYANNPDTANENALLEDLLAQLVPTGSGTKI